MENVAPPSPQINRKTKEVHLNGLECFLLIVVCAWRIIKDISTSQI